MPTKANGKPRMHDLEDLARAVVANWEKGDLAGAVSALATALRQMEHDREDVSGSIHRALELYGSDDCNIDEAPLISFANEGVWVSAWVWVPTPT